MSRSGRSAIGQQAAGADSETGYGEAPSPAQSTVGHGRLAQIVASRSGLAAPEASMVLAHREALIYMLCQAAELEHGIMCQYLFAAFSLKQRVDEGMTSDELAAVLRWRRQIAHVGTHSGSCCASAECRSSAPGPGRSPPTRTRRASSTASKR